MAGVFGRMAERINGSRDRIDLRGRMGGMKCSSCGREIAPFDARLDSRDVMKKKLTDLGWGRKFAFMSLCPECPESRDAVRRTLGRPLGIIGAATLALAIVGVLIHLLR